MGRETLECHPWSLLLVLLFSTSSWNQSGIPIPATAKSLQSCLTLCDPMDCSMRTSGLLVPHHLLEFPQVHGHWVGDAIQPSHPLSPPYPALSLCQHQGLFQWVSSLHQVANVLEFQLQHESFQWIFRTDFFRIDRLISLQSKGLSRVFSNTTVQKHRFFGAQLSLESNSHIHTWLLEKP